MTYTIWDYDGNGTGFQFPTLDEARTAAQSHEDPCFVEDSTGQTVYDWPGKAEVR